MLEWVQKLFGLEILLSAVSAFGRPDYNLPLFVFAFMIWDFPKSQHTRVIYLLIFSTFIDTIYLIYWGMLWHSKLFQEYAYDNLIHEIVLDVSIAILVVKVIAIFLTIIYDPEVKRNMQISEISHNVVQFFSFQNNIE